MNMYRGLSCFTAAVAMVLWVSGLVTMPGCVVHDKERVVEKPVPEREHVVVEKPDDRIVDHDHVEVHHD